MNPTDRSMKSALWGLPSPIFHGLMDYMDTQTCIKMAKVSKEWKLNVELYLNESLGFQNVKELNTIVAACRILMPKDASFLGKALMVFEKLKVLIETTETLFPTMKIEAQKDLFSQFKAVKTYITGQKDSVVDVLYKHLQGLFFSKRIRRRSSQY